MIYHKYLLVVCLVLWVKVKAQSETTLTWQDSSKLNWQDFKDEVDDESEAVASTATGITFGYTIGTTNNVISSFKAEVYAHFYPLRSWVKSEGLNTHVLKHEQLHFDITELHARLFRKALQELRVGNNLKQRIESLHNQISNDLDRMQSLYDNETRHSLDKAAQERWDKEVSEGLKALKSYAKTEILVKKY
jgi:hypothetical protein